MNFLELKKSITKFSIESRDFLKMTSTLQEELFELSRKQLIAILKEIGTMPEYIVHDSTEEKLYSKVTDILLAKSLQELGIRASVNTERANCADVVGRSSYHEYSLVGDAKAFRLSRTARNQKDFEVKSLADWKIGNDYAVLVCPYFKYPKNSSQIYGQALDSNTCLFSWEHLCLLLEKDVRETPELNLSFLWNVSSEISENVFVNDKNNNLYKAINNIVCTRLNISYDDFLNYFCNCKKSIINRSRSEIRYWHSKIEEVKGFSKQKAINELLKSLKIKEKINSIEKYIKELKG
ncbi:MAG: HindIII family type II restriction endonuclease [Endomicrobium sp.]|jgi:type II restriction enzyme|nr:HindIII family type II restriction endonuclease [Endomicrobium sp.]